MCRSRRKHNSRRAATASENNGTARRFFSVCHSCCAAIYIILCATLISGCSVTSVSSGGQPLEHTRLLRLGHTGNFMRADILDPWNEGAILQSYVLVPHDSIPPHELPAGATLLRIPLKRAVAFTSLHAALICDLGADGRLAGVCDAAYLFHPILRKRLENGTLADFGSSMHPDLERITTATADALLVSPFQNAGNGNVSATGIPLIACADYMEPTPLGQAEWMKFYGLLFGCEARSDSLFTQVETAYDSLRCAVSAVKERPRLMIDMKQGAAWYVPGGGSYLGQMYADAGADYIFSARDESGAIPLSFESVYAAAREADVWLVKYGQAADLTYNKLAADFGPYSNFRPWRERRMWGCNTFAVPYYEETPFRPDRLLRDFIRIFHPELLPDHELRYFKPLR